MSNVNRKHIMREKKLKSLERKTRNKYGCGAYYNEDLGRYVRTYIWKRHNSYKSFLRTHSNRVARRWNRRLCYDINHKENCTYTSRKSCKYRKLYDYWWDLF